MARQRYELDTRVLTAFFFAAMPFVAFGSFVVVNMAKTQLRQSVGTNLEQRAVQAKLGLEQYLNEQLAILNLVAVQPETREALARAKEPSAADAALHERDWASGKSSKLADAIVESPLAGRLRSVVSVRPGFRQLQVVSLAGRTVAASRRGGRLVHTSAGWFRLLSTTDAEPEPHVGELEQPKGSGSTFLEIVSPVRDADGAAIGAVRALVDGTEIYTVLAPVRVGKTGHAVLLRQADGLVLASDESERNLKATYPGFDALRNALEGFPIGESAQALFGRSLLKHGYWTVPEVSGVEPARLVGFSPVDRAPDAKWLLTVEQDLDEALAPVATVTRYLWIHFIGVFATVILLALYFSFKLERPVMEEALHLHEEHLPAGVRSQAEG